MMRASRSALIRRVMVCALVVLLVRGVNAGPASRDRLGDPLPPGAVARLGTTRLRHDRPVTAVAFAPDGKTLASGGEDGVIRIWETATGREMHCLRGRQDQIGSLRYSPDGKILASAGGYGGIVVWDPAIGTRLDQLGHQNEQFSSLAFSPDGKTLAASLSGTIVWWGVATGDRLRTLDGEHNGIASIAYAPDGKTVAYACCDEAIGLCDPATGKEIRTLRKSGKYPIDYAPSVAYSPDGKKLLVTDSGTIWRLLDVATGKELAVDDGPPFYRSPAFSPDGRLIATMPVVWERWPWLWDVSRKKGRPMRGISRAGDGRAAAFSSDGKLLASGGQDGRVRLWDVAAGKEVDLPTGAAIGGRFALSRDGKTLAALDGNHTVRLWDTAGGKLLHQWDASNRPEVPSLALSPDGSQVIVPGMDDKDGWRMQARDAATGRERWHTRGAEGAAFVAYSPDGALLAAPSTDHKIRLWDTANGRPLGRLEGHESFLLDGTFSPDGKLLVTAAEDHTVRVWDVTARRERHRLKGHGGGARVSCLAFSADGRCLATGGDDDRICVWDPHTGRRLHRWAIDEEQVTCLALSADGALLVANAGEGRFRLWDVEAGTAGPAIEGHRGSITFAAFQPDGRTLLTAGRDGTALVWDVAALRRRPSQAPPSRTDANGDPLPPDVLARLGSLRLRHDRRIRCAAYSPDGKLLATAPEHEERGGLRLWDAATGKEMHRLAKGPLFGAAEIHFSADGKTLATRSERVIQLWDVASGTSLGTVLRCEDGLGCFALAPDGKTMAVADKGISLRDLDTGEVLRRFDRTPNRVDQMVFAADGKTLLVCAGGDRLRGKMDEVSPGYLGTWDVATGKRLRHFPVRSTLITLAPKGGTFAYLDLDKHLHLGSCHTGEELWRSKNSDCFHVFSSDGQFLLTGDRGRPFHLRRARTGEEVRRSPGTVDFEGSWACLSPSGTTLAVASHDEGRMELWDVESGRERRPFVGHRRTVTCLAFAPDGRTLVSGSEEGTLRFWDAAAGKELRVLRTSGGGIAAVAFSRDGKRIASCDRHNVFRLRDAATGAELWRFDDSRTTAEEDQSGARSVALTPDGRTLVGVGEDSAVYVWDASSHTLRRHFEAFSGSILSVSHSPDGQSIACAGDDSGVRGSRSADMIRLWELASGRKKLEIDRFARGWVTSVAFSPDGKLLAIGQGFFHPPDLLRHNLQIAFWEIASGTELFHIDTHANIAGFSPDGQYLIATDGALWDMSDGKEVGQVGRDDRYISAFAFSLDGRLVATGDPDGTILVQTLPRPPRQKSMLVRELSAHELQSLWTALASPSGASVWRAMRTLMANPRQSVPFLQSLLRPHPPIDRERLARLLADLDSNRFSVREQARGELSKLGELAEPALRRTLEGKPSLEVRRQVLALLEQVERDARSPEALRVGRVIAVLERIGTAESIALLRRLAAGAPEARLSRDAAGALKRLERRNGRP